MNRVRPDVAFIRNAVFLQFRLVCGPRIHELRIRRAPSERGIPLYEEYQQGTTLEARLVKACDKLQLMLKVAVYERWGERGLAEFWDNPDNFPDPGFPVVAELFAELRARRQGERA